MKDFKNLTVWQKAHALTLEVYRVTATFPKEAPCHSLRELYATRLFAQRNGVASFSLPQSVSEIGDNEQIDQQRCGVNQVAVLD